MALRPGLLAAAVACLACSHPAVTAPEPLAGVPPERLARLARSANLTRWSPLAAEPWRGGELSDVDLGLIRSLGFTAVRLVVPLNQLFRPAVPDSLSPAMLASLDRMLDRLLAQDLCVIVDPHFSATDRRFETDSAYTEAFVRFWTALAHHLSRRDPERVFLEVVNEPVFAGRAGDWPPIQQRLLAAMRREAPRHTLIAAGTGWSSITGLLRLPPVADRNIVYTFHFYEPFEFTHQGEPWAGPPGALRGVPYPADSAACARSAEAQRDSAAAQAVRRYCAEGWDSSLIIRQLARAAAWGRQHAVPVFLGEFGASRTAAPRADRAAWIRDVRVAAERLGVPWGVWGFDDRFGLDARRGPDGVMVVDMSVVRALGLRADSTEVSRLPYPRPHGRASRATAQE
jgi:endoglucanase